MLFDGCLLVVDRFVSSAGERLVDFPLNGLAKLAAHPEGMEPFTDELGQTPAYRLPHDLQVKTVAEQPFSAHWVEGDRGMRLHALGDGFQALAYDVAFDDGRTVRVLISLDGGAYRSDACAADAETRIALHVLRD